MATSNKDSVSKFYELKEQLLLLTMLVATVTYLCGLNLPGGAWQKQQEGGQLTGDPILRDTHYRRYLVFYYCNAMALVSSVVVCLILVMLRRNSTIWTVVLRVVMVLNLLSLMGSYVAGTCRDAFTTIWAVALSFPVLAYIAYVFVCYLRLTSGRNNNTLPGNTNTGYKEKEKIEVLMLLATFAFTSSYSDGLNPPGGFWISTEQQEHGLLLLHLAGDPIMQDSRLRRYQAFFVCNTTALIASFLIILLLLDKKLSRTISARFLAVYGFIAVALLGLMGAYAAGSCRGTDDTVKVISLCAAVPACVGLQLALNYVFHWKLIKNMRHTFSIWSKKSRPAGDSALALKNTSYFAMVLASFAVCITYQAALSPPGGLWQDNMDGHKIGHPVLQTTHPARYRVFFYSNSAVFVTSLLVVMMVQSKYLLTLNTLVASMVLELIGLLIAYFAGTFRDLITSIYLVTSAAAVFVWAVLILMTFEAVKKDAFAEPVSVPATPVVEVVVAPVTPFAARRVGGGRSNEQLEDKRQVLLLIAILQAALSYQAGLATPGGFWPANDKQLGHRAGYPVLLDNYPRRYKAFLYCNGACFMASVSLILLLLNRTLCRPGIRWYALHLCMAVGMFALMGAYASGSSRHRESSIYVVTLVVAVSASVLLQYIFFSYRLTHHDEPTTRRRRVRGQRGIDRENDEEIEYLMLLGILAASVTYQSGLRPPGGMWQEDSGAYSAGNPILHDINKRRYDIFLYSNSASFMASVVAIIMLLPFTLSNLEWLRRCLPFRAADLKWPLWPVYTAILVDMLGLLVAYTAGSTRDWESTRNVICIIVPIPLYIAAYAAVPIWMDTRRKHRRSSQSSSMQADRQMLPLSSSQ